jgi:polyisoprenoid-binding protein YceI
MKIRPLVGFKRRTQKLSAGFAILIFSLASILPGGAQTRYSAQPNVSSVKIDGTSTAHDWQMEGKLIGGFAELDSGVELDTAQTTIAGLKDGKLPIKVHALIPVRTVHSKAEHAPDVMDHLMQEHLKADQFGTIEYTLTEMTFKGPHAANTPFEFDATGLLAIAGVTNKVSFPVAIDMPAANKMNIKAVVPIKMTSYGVDPPAPNIGLGLMRCGDDIKITIDWTLVKKN